MKKLEKKLDDLKAALSLARKAGYVIVGLDNLMTYDKKLYLLLCDTAAGKSLAREMNFLSTKRNIPLIFVEDLQGYVSIRNCKAVGIRNKNFSEKIAEIANSNA